MAAVVKLHDATRLGGKIDKRHPRANLPRPKGIGKNKLASSIGPYTPKLSEDALSASSSLATSTPLPTGKPESYSGPVPFDMKELRDLQKAPKDHGNKKQANVQSVPKVSKKKKQKVKGKQKDCAIQDDDPQTQALVTALKESNKLNKKEVIEEAIITMPVSDRRKNVREEEKVEQVHIPESYYNWLELNTPLLKKSNRPAGYVDWLDVNDVELEIVEVDTAVYDYVGNLRLDYTRRIIGELHLVPKVWGSELRDIAVARMMRSKYSAYGTQFQGPIFPPQRNQKQVAAANDDTPPWSKDTVEVTPKNLLPFYEGRVIGELEYKDSVDAQRHMLQDSSRAELWVKLERVRQGYSFSDFTIKHIPHASTKVLAKTTDTVEQYNNAEESNKIVPITEAKSYVKPGNACDTATAEQRRNIWIEKGSPKYHLYRSPTGKQMYEDGLTKVKALDHAQQTEYYLASKTCMRAWHFEKIDMLQENRRHLWAKIHNKQPAVDADESLAREMRNGSVGYSIYWSKVEGASCLFKLEVNEPSFDYAKYEAKDKEWRKLHRKMKQKAKLNSILEARAKRKQEQERALQLERAKKDPYRLGIGASRTNDVANDKVEQVASTINPVTLTSKVSHSHDATDPISIKEQVVTDRDLFLYNKMMEESSSIKDSSIISDVYGLIKKTEELPNYFGRFFKTTTSGIMVPV